LDTTSLITLYSILVVGCLILSSILSSYETALTWINRYRLKSIAKKKSKRGKKAGKVYKLKENFTSTLTVILIWNNIFNITATTLLNLIFDQLFKGGNLAAATTIAIATSTTLIIIFGEIIPKNLAFRNSEKLAIKTIYFMLFFTAITFPLVWIVKNIAKKSQNPSTEGDLIDVLDSSENEGVFEHHEKELIKSSVQIKEKKVIDSMVPWSQVHWIRIRPSKAELINIIKDKYHFSRLPVLNQSKNRVVGFIKMKDVYAYLILNNKNPFFDNQKIDLTDLLLTPLYVKEDDNILDVMELLQQKKLHMAVVTTRGIEQSSKTKERNKLTGILTLEDVLEELIGEIYDEHDEIHYNEPVVKTGLDSFIIRGNVNFHTIFNNYLDETNKPEGNFKTFHDWVQMESKLPLNQSFYWIYENLEISVFKITKKVILYKVVENTPKYEGLEDEDDKN